jgi:pectate lyase
MLSSLQGTDALGDGTFSGENGGIIKAFGNVMIGCNDSITYSENNKSFDYYDASSRDEVVPSTVKTLVGGTTYNNFDTSSSMYNYTLLSEKKQHFD